MKRVLLAGVMTAALTCGMGPPDFDDLAGSYEGTVRAFGFNPLYTIAGSIEATVTQNLGDIEGTERIVAVACLHEEWCSDFIRPVSFTGTVEEGHNPTVTMALAVIWETRDCPDQFDTYGGLHLSDKRRITLSGTLAHLSADCERLPPLAMNLNLIKS